MEFEEVVNGLLTVKLLAPALYADSNNTHCHTGFNTLFLDTVMGACVLGELKQFVPIATVKLTCNHMDQAKIGEAIRCEAIQETQKNEISYVSAKIISSENERILSHAIGTFMIGTTSKPLEFKS